MPTDWAFRALAALAATCLLWSAEAAWGRYEIPGTRFKFDLAPLMAALSATALLVAVATDVTRRRRSVIVLASIIGALTMVVALRLLTGNVATAMRVYAGHSVEMNGSGLTAAWLVVFAFIGMAALSLAGIMAQRRGAVI